MNIRQSAGNSRCFIIPLAMMATVMALALPVASPAGSHVGDAPAYIPSIDSSEFSLTIDNPYFTLEPGTTFIYKTETSDGLELNKVEVTGKTRVVMGVKTRVVRDRVWLNDDLVEETFDWYAQDNKGNVWYFGEDSRELEHGKVTSTGGSWEAGVDGAQPGIIMPGNPEPGEPYRQEYYEGEAEDMGQVISTDAEVTVPFGSYTGCLKTKEWTPLEPSVQEYKYYSRETRNVILETDATGKMRTQLVDIRNDEDDEAGESDED